MAGTKDREFDMSEWNELNEIIAYEEGSLTKEQTIAMFQRLINNGLVWQLQGHYGRVAAEMLQRGLCSPAN